MIVYTDSVKKLVRDVIRKYETETNSREGEPSAQEFFDSLITHLNDKIEAELSPDTFYKHYSIRLKSHTSSTTGYSLNYLNALSYYAYEKDYLDVFSAVEQTMEDIPEFPFDHPAFPASPAIKIEYNGYRNLWIKDESYNPCGVHKDRKAHEIYLFYDKIIKEKVTDKERIQLPYLSIISAGYAALSIQYRLRQTGLPALKVLIDKTMPDKIKTMLENSRAEIYEVDLSKKKLSSEEVLKLTRNENGIDLTYGDKISLTKESYYDWLAFESLNLNPNVLITPYGSGELFRNILEIHTKELKLKHNSKRYFANKEIVKNCIFLGATAKEKKSRMFALASFFDTQKRGEIKNLMNQNYCGFGTGIYEVEEDNALMDKAIKIAEKNKLHTTESGIAGLTLLIQMEKEKRNIIDKNKKIVIVNTGKIKEELFNSPL